jgi:hypothetical protein
VISVFFGFDPLGVVKVTGTATIFVIELAGLECGEGLLMAG